MMFDTGVVSLFYDTGQISVHTATLYTKSVVLL